MNSQYSLLDHTADIGIEVSGKDLSGLLENTAFALFDIITTISQVKPVHKLCINIPFKDSEGIMRHWLEELLFRFNGYDYLFSKFHVSADISGNLTGYAWGEVFDPERHLIHTEIKGITYHQFEVVRKENGWFSRIIFDV